MAEPRRTILGKLTDKAICRGIFHGVPGLIYDHRCSGSEAYMKLAREMIGRLPVQAAAA